MAGGTEGSPLDKFRVARQSTPSDATTLNVHLSLWYAFQSARDEVRRWTDDDARNAPGSFAADAVVALVLGGAALSAALGVNSEQRDRIPNLAELLDGSEPGRQLHADGFPNLYDKLRHFGLGANEGVVRKRLLSEESYELVLRLLDGITAVWRDRNLPDDTLESFGDGG